MRTVPILKVAALVLLVGITTPMRAHAAWIAPTLEQVGFSYFIFAQRTHETTLVPWLAPADAQAMSAPYGPNAASYAYCYTRCMSDSGPPSALGASLGSYYIYLGYLYAHQNYLYPEYAAQLQSFYFSYADSLSAYYESVYLFNWNYWNAACAYYETLIFNPYSTQTTQTSNNSAVDYTSTSGSFVLSGITTSGAGTLSLLNTNGLASWVTNSGSSVTLSGGTIIRGGGVSESLQSGSTNSSVFSFSQNLSDYSFFNSWTGGDFGFGGGDFRIVDVNASTE